MSSIRLRCFQKNSAATVEFFPHGWVIAFEHTIARVVRIGVICSFRQDVEPVWRLHFLLRGPCGRFYQSNRKVSVILRS